LVIVLDEYAIIYHENTKVLKHEKNTAGFCCFGRFRALIIVIWDLFVIWCLEFIACRLCSIICFLPPEILHDIRLVCLKFHTSGAVDF
jgi:hypothetical protein